MIDEPRNNPREVAFQYAGTGMEARRLCMGCNQSKSILCSSGVGVRWRCCDCLAAARARAASQPQVREEA